MSSVRVKLYELYQMVPSPLKILDSLLFSEPFIEKCTTFEMKSLLVSYSVSVGIFFDERVTKNVRRFVLSLHVGLSTTVWVFCTFYLTDLVVYDVDAIALGVIPIIFTSFKIAYGLAVYYLFEITEKVVEFFIDDHHHPSSANPTERVTGTINIKPWIIVVIFALFGAQACVDVLFDAEIETGWNHYTKKPHFIKHFPMWYPFGSSWLKSLVSIFQDAMLMLEILAYCSGIILIFIIIIMMHNKFALLYEKLKTSSESTFERIDNLDNALEEIMMIKNERYRSKRIRDLDKEKVRVMEVFYGDFVSCVKRYQQLQRIQIELKKILDYCYSVTYCFILINMVGHGFRGAESLRSTQPEFNFIVNVMTWFVVCGGIWFMNCVLGDLFSMQNDLFADEVYAMPWYHFSPKQRKTVLTFLSVIQKPTYLRALKLFTLKKDLFPDFLKSVYSYIQIMFTLQSVKHHNF